MKQEIETFRQTLISNNPDIDKELDLTQILKNAVDATTMLTDALTYLAEEEDCPCCKESFNVLTGHSAAALQIVAGVDLRFKHPELFEDEPK